MHQIVIALLFNIIDLVTGFTAALKNKELQSSKMRDGVFKKCGFILTYIVAYLIDVYGCQIGMAIGFDVLPIMIAYTIAIELVSICENIHKINPDLLPEKLISILNSTHTLDREGMNDDENK